MMLHMYPSDGWNGTAVTNLTNLEMEQPVQCINKKWVKQYLLRSMSFSSAFGKIFWIFFFTMLFIDKIQTFKCDSRVPVLATIGSAISPSEAYSNPTAATYK